jgi:hypothetical protein
MQAMAAGNFAFIKIDCFHPPSTAIADEKMTKTAIGEVLLHNLV